MIEDLVGSTPPDQFFNEYWQKKWLVSRGAGKAITSLFSYDDFAGAVYQAELGIDNYGMRKHGQTSNALIHQMLSEKILWEQPPTPEQVVAACSGSGTLVFNGIESRCADLREWTQGLVQALSEVVSVNAYFSPRGDEPGLELHYDPQEIFVVQICGRKRWELSTMLEVNPLIYASSKTAPPPETELVLEPGDVLYIPRGLWHRATADEEHSLHLTVTLVCRNLMAFSAWLADEVAIDPAMRADLPLLGGEENFAQFEQAVGMMAGKFAEVLADPELARRFSRKSIAEACLRAAKGVRGADQPTSIG